MTRKWSGLHLREPVAAGVDGVGEGRRTHRAAAAVAVQIEAEGVVGAVARLAREPVEVVVAEALVERGLRAGRIGVGEAGDACGVVVGQRAGRAGAGAGTGRVADGVASEPPECVVAALVGR